MAIMILGAPQVYSCQSGGGMRMHETTLLSDMEIFPMITLNEEIKTGSGGEPLDPGDWVRLQATHCQPTQSVLTFLCRPDGHPRSVKFENFRQPCGVEAAACKEAARTRLLMIVKMEHAVVMNMTRSHMGGDEDCPQGWGHRTKFLYRKINQILMEILIEKEWVWCIEAARTVTTMSGKTALVRQPWSARPVRWSWRSGSVCGRRCQELERWSFPQPGEALDLSTKSRTINGRMQIWSGYSSCAAGECAADAAFRAEKLKVAILRWLR
jgi:hypothetical protein